MRLHLALRPPRPLGALAGLALGLLCSACIPEASGPQARIPCDGDATWDPNRPLVLAWSGVDGIAADSSEFRNGVRLQTARGVEVDWFVRDQDGGTAVICPKGGLVPNTSYQWTVSDFTESPSTNQASVPPFDQAGSWGFRTADMGTWTQVRSFADCELSAAQVTQARAETCPEDTGFNEDSGASGEGS